MSDDILKQLVLGDDLANEIGDFNFANLGFSFADFEADEKPGKSSKKADKRGEKVEEHAKIKNRLGKKKPQNTKEALLSVSNLINPENENLENSNDEIFEKENYLENSANKSLDLVQEKNLLNKNIDKSITGLDKAAEDYGNFSFLPPRRIPQEKDLDLQLICVHDGEKIYKLSDLFVPKDEKIIKKIERYNNKIMSISEKEKYEKENDGQKKEVNETEEIKQIIKKAKRNQKFTKINITYDEKFFDRTHFLENIHASTLAHQEIVLQENKELIKKQILQEGLLKSFGVANERKIGDDIVERNLLNALFYVKVKLNEKDVCSNKNKDKADFSDEEGEVGFDNYLAADYLINFKAADGIGFYSDYKHKNFDAEDNLNYTEYAASQLKHGVLSEQNKKAKEDKGDLLSYKNTNFSDLSFSHETNNNNTNKRNLLSENTPIDPNEFDEVIKIDFGKNENKNLNVNSSLFAGNYANKHEAKINQTPDLNKPSALKEAFLLSAREKAFKASSAETKSSTAVYEKASFEETEILKLNLLIKENVEKNMKFDPEDLKHDKYLLGNNNNYNNFQNEIIESSSSNLHNNNLINRENDNENNILNDNNNNNNLNAEGLRDRNLLNVQSIENDLGEESHNHLMDLDYLNHSNNFNNSNLKMEMDFENLNNFSFQNKKLNFPSSNQKNSNNSGNDKSNNMNDSSLNNSNSNNINNNISGNSKAQNNSNFASQPHNLHLNAEPALNINKPNTFSSNVNIKDSEAKNSMFNAKNNKKENSAKKTFSAKKSKYSNISNDEFNQENEEFDNYEDNSELEDNEEELEENENSDQSDDKGKIPEDIFETKEFKIFNLHESALLKSTLESNSDNNNYNNENNPNNEYENLKTDNVKYPKADEMDNVSDLNNLAAQKILDFKFSKPFPNAAKEKTFLQTQNEEPQLGRRPLKSLSMNYANEAAGAAAGLYPNTQSELNAYSSFNNLNDLHDLNFKKGNLNNKSLNENLFNKQTPPKPEKEFLGLKKERDIADNYDLFNKSKCQKFKKQAFYNEFLLTGEYLQAIILSEEDLKNPKHKFFEVSKKIFDLNDYNMNFEILKADSLSGFKKDKDKDKETGKEDAEAKEPGGREESANAVAIDLGTGLPQTKAEMSLRDAELITEPLPILPLNEDVSKQNILILGLNSSVNAVNNRDLALKAEVASQLVKENLNNLNYNNYAINNTNNTNNLINTASPEDFFTNFQSKLNANNTLNQNFLKIGKAKGNLLTHAKCSYNLTYNKINLTYDDLRDFHRPNFCKFLLREKKKKNFSFLISEKYNISKGDRIKRWDCAILTRNFLKKQEKKRISKNIQYMNAYEIFKDRHKLSLNDGKYALFEHIDEYPLFASNFGMASKLKKFLYTPKLFNVNVANPNTKLSDVELKTYNVTGPYGSQILLQPNQKLPLVGQIDLNELKGMSVLDNKMYRAPVFYEKIKNPVLLKPKGDIENEPEQQQTENNYNSSKKDNAANNLKSEMNASLNNNLNTNENDKNNVNLNSNNNEKTTNLNSHSHHTRRRNVLSINLNNSTSGSQSKRNKNREADKEANTKNNNTNNINNNNLNSESKHNLSSDPQKKEGSNLINLGNNISIDPSNIQVVEKDGKKYYNFLLTFRKSKEAKESFTIREIEHAYTVAQEEPKIEVYPPQSRQYNNFLKKKIQTYTYKLYDEIGYKRGINFKEFTNLFPNVTEQILKKNFREMNIEIDKNICFFTKIPSEDNHMLITPENICQFESCQFGIYKLREVGIKNITNPDKISYATNKFINQTPDAKQQFLARVTEEELLTTPWNITQNFLQAKQIKGMLAIKGIGDPSNGQGGYSFLKMPVKNYNDNKTLKEEIDILKNANKNIKTVTGTDADLRKLSKDDIKMKLIQLGQDEEIINKLSRWERVSLLRYRSSQAAQMGYEGDITKYARGTRMNSKLQRDTYQKNINEVFKKQVQYIVGENQDNYISDSEESEDENLFENNYYNQTIDLDEEDPKKGLNFMKNEIYSNPNNKKKKRPEPKRSGAANEQSAKKQTEEKIIKLYKKTNEEVPIGDANTKIKLDFKNIDIQFLNRKKKSSSNMGDIYEYELDKTTSLLSRKRRDTPERSFNEAIEDIVDNLIKFDNTKIFHNPVKKKDYKDYYDLIKNPIDLGSIKNKTKRNEYKLIQQFLDDVDLLVNNSRTYNGEEHEVTLQAQRIRDFALKKIEENNDKITELETKLHNKEE